MKEEIEKHEPSFIGFQAKHRFRTRTRGGNFTIGDYIFIIDPKFQEILSVRDLDDEDERRIRRIISEARTIQFQE